VGSHWCLIENLSVSRIFLLIDVSYWMLVILKHLLSSNHGTEYPSKTMTKCSHFTVLATQVFYAVQLQLCPLSFVAQREWYLGMIKKHILLYTGNSIHFGNIHCLLSTYHSLSYLTQDDIFYFHPFACKTHDVFILNS